jgi:hypothetical protein
MTQEELNEKNERIEKGRKLRGKIADMESMLTRARYNYTNNGVHPMRLEGRGNVGTIINVPESAKDLIFKIIVSRYEAQIAEWKREFAKL